MYDFICLLVMTTIPPNGTMIGYCFYSFWGLYWGLVLTKGP